MSSTPFLQITAVLLLLLVPATPAADIPIEGVSDRSVTADRAWFRIPSTPDHLESALLDGRPVPFDVTQEVVDPDFHELLVTRTPTGGGPSESRQIRFIVRASERGSTEWGLPPWTPPAIVPASAAELAPGRLRFLVPGRFPTGLPIPFAVWLDAPDGHALRAHALLTSPSHDPILLRRGAGSGQIPSSPLAGVRTYTASIPGHAFARELTLEDAADWQEAGGSLSTDTTWPPDARIDLTRTLTLPAGVTLTIGAGSVIRVGAGVDLLVEGALLIRGTPDQPVVFLPAGTHQPWGGFVVRGAAARFEAEAALFTGSGAHPTWFDANPGYDVHRREQALLLVDGARAVLRDCAAIDGHGQFGHGRDADLEIDRSLVQRFITGGEYSGGSVRIRDSALLEFPRDDAVFADADNDAIYFTSGRHSVTDTVIGWAKDDGIDAGSGGAGSVLASNVWVEAVFHEAFAWSGGGRVATNLHCVALHCGQGIECGWSTGADSPLVFASDCLSLGNASGVRFGDNYDWSYNGFLRVTQSILLHNHRDIFDLNWSDWTPRPAQLDLRGNWVSTPHPRHPDNTLWDSERDGARLAAFANSPADAPPGLGFATRTRQSTLPGPLRGLLVGLSRFSPHPVRVDYVIESSLGTVATGTLTFTPGEMLRHLLLPPSATQGSIPLRVRLLNPQHAELTTPPDFHLLPAGTTGPVTLIPKGSTWRYRDTGADPGGTWMLPDYDDSAWAAGRAKLGFGDGDETTVIDGGPTGDRHPTVWFRHGFVAADTASLAELEVRLRRDDGARVHLNGVEVFRSNLPAGPVDAGTYTGQGTSSESQFFTQRIPASLLRPGENVIAIDVHQADATSSDLGFDLELVAFPAPRLAFHRISGDTVMLWDVPGFQLETAPTVQGPWLPVPDATSPHPLSDVTTTTTTTFHRLRQVLP